jgi:hypothetical protein
MLEIRPRLRGIESDLESINSHLSRIEHKPTNVMNVNDIRSIIRGINNVQAGVNRLSGFIWDSATRYEANEEDIVRKAQMIFLMDVMIGNTPVINMKKKRNDSIWTTMEETFLISYLNYKDKDGITEHKADKIINRKTGASVPKAPERVGTIIEVKGERKIERAAIAGEMDYIGEYGTVKTDYKALSASAVAEISAGLYVYDAKGKKILAPGVKAEVGISASLVEVGGEGRVGLGKDNNLLGAYGDVEARAGVAEAKATVIAGLYNAQGEVDINAKASASAGVYVGEVEGSVGGTVMGIDAGVTGKLNVGLGGSADIGISGGKVKGEIGLSIGVGFKVGFEIDVGGFFGACKSLL